MSQHRLIVALALAAAIGPRGAAANPMLQARFGGLRGDPLYKGAFSLYWNPAALAQGVGGFGTLHFNGVAREASYTRDAESNGIPPEQRAANAGRATVTTGGVVPALAGGYSMELADFDLGLGAGAYVSYAGQADWDRNRAAPPEHPGALDGPQRWHTISTQVRLLSTSAGAGLRYRRYGLSLGVAPVLSFASLATVRARNADRSEELVDVTGALKEGRALFEGDDVVLNWIVGGRWEVSDELAFGVTWHEGPKVRFEGKARVALGTAPETTEAARLPLDIGDTFRAASRIDATPWLTVRPMVEYARWSILQRQDAVAIDDGAILVRQERQFQDTLAGRLRGDFHLGPTFDLLAGAGLETGATPPQTHEPGLAEASSFDVGLGLAWEASDHLRVLVSAVYVHFLETTVTQSVHEPPANGTYTDERQFVTVDLELR